MNNLPQFFINRNSISDGKVLITGNDSRHLASVRRVRPGEHILLRSDDGKGYTAEILKISDEGITVLIIDEIQQQIEIPDILLFMAILKGGNFEFVIQKAVEIGVNRIVPVVTERTIPDPDKINQKKLERWNKIASEAAKQCLRAIPAYVSSPVLFNDVVAQNIDGLKIICHPGAKIQLKASLEYEIEKSRISLFIGPEGGFSDKEITAAREAEWVVANLGASHLRAETAALIIPSIVIYEWSRN